MAAVGTAAREAVGELEARAAEALKAYGLGGELRVSLIRDAVNRTYRVEDGRGRRFAFREYRPSAYGPLRVRSEVLWLEALAEETGLRLALPLRTTAGRPAVELPGGSSDESSGGQAGEAPREGVLFHWLEGDAGDTDLDLPAVEALGTVLGRIHRHGRDFPLPADFSRPVYDLEGLLGPEGGADPVLDVPELSAADRRTVAEAAELLRQRLGSLPVTAETFGLVHGDLTPQNVLLVEGVGGLGVVDFADGGFGYYLYDVATSLLRFRDRPDYRQVQQALLRGYRRAMALDPAHEILLEPFQAARQIYLLRWLCRYRDLEEVAEGAADGFPFVVAQLRRFLDRHQRSSSAGEEGAPKGEVRTLVQLLADLQAADIDLWAEGEKLRFSAPKGALTAELKGEIKERRDELLRFLSRAAADSSGEEGIPEADKSGPLPLSFAQERLWFFDRLEPESSAYNLSPAFRLKGAVDVGTLERALATVVRRHAVLRTRYEEVGGRPRQRMEEKARAPLPLMDLRGLAAGPAEAAVGRALDRAARTPFDLGRAPVLRAALFRLGEAEHVFLVVVHHIAFDGWSSGVMMGELLAAYRSLEAGEEPRLPALPIQYADFAVWQRDWLQGEVLEEQLAFWKERLRGAPHLLELPPDRPRRPGQGNRGAKHLCWFSSRTTELLRDHCRGRELTPFMVLVSTFSLVLGRWTGRRDVLVGSPIANRNRPELEGLVGFFANTLVYRTETGPKTTAEELWRRCREASVGAYAHQDLPFERLVEELEPERDPLHPPLVQVLFALENVATPSASGAGMEVEAIQADSGSVPFELIALMREEDGRFRLSLRYRTALFDATTIRRLGTWMEHLAAGLLERPDRPVDEVSLLPPAQAHQMLVEWPVAPTPFPGHRNVPQLFAETAAASPETPALVYGEQQISYGELDERSRRWAGRLAELGVAPESLVGVALERSPELVTAFLSILRAGGAYLPLDAAYPDERIAFMLEDTAAPAVLVDATTRSRLAALTADLPPERRPRLLDVSGGALDGGPPADLDHRASPENLAYVIYTSGSTGRPKGVAIPHRAIVRLVRESSYLEVAPEDRFAQISNASFDAATYEIWGALLNGAGLVGLQRETVLDPMALGEALGSTGATHLFLTVALFNQVASLAPAAFAGCKQVLAGGEAVDPSALAAVLDAGPPAMLGNGYGPTESTTFAAVQRVEAPVPASVPLGRGISNTQLWVAGREGRAVPPGAFGELLIGGDGLGRGYLHRPALTAERFVPDAFSGEAGSRVYRTGDLVRWRPRGLLEFAGRLDHQIKLRGFRIELGEIETALSAVPGVSGAVVIVTGEGAAGRRLVAYLECPGGGVSPEAARQAVLARLPDYMVPSTFVFLDAFPLTPNGKVDRRALPDPVEEAGDGEAFRSPQEELLAAIWAEVLERNAVSREEDFFEAGGHSLMATRVVSRVREVFGVEMPLAWIFEDPTVAALAPRLSALQAGSNFAPPLVPSGEEGPAPLSYAQQRLWFLDRLEPESATYNMPAPVLLRGALDGRSLELALERLLERQQALATIFPEADGDPVQVVRLPGRRPLPRLDLTALPEAERSREGRRLASRDAMAPFDLARGPLLRASLLRLGGEEHLLLLCLHHVVSDGWSMGILLRELTALYGALAAGEEPSLPALPVQYADFARWQRSWLQGEVLEAELDFWRQHLEGAPALLELPVDRPRPAVQTSRGGTRRLAFGKSLTESLQQLSRRQGATLFMLLLAAFQVLMSRLSGQREVVVGSPIAGRNRKETEGLIGFFVNTLALKSTVEGSFAGLLSEVRRHTLAAYAHQDVPFERLVEQLQPRRDLSTSPLFQVMLILQNAPGARLETRDLTLEPVVASSGTAKFDLTLSLQEGEEGLRGAVEHNLDLFDGTTVERWMGALKTLLAGVADGSALDRPVTELPLLTPGQRHQLALEWNGPALGELPAAGLHELFLRRARETPEGTALVDGEESWTYGELEAASARLARRLRGLGAGPEARVGVLLERRGRLVAALLAVLRSGGAYVPLDPAYPQERLAFMVEDAGARAVITDAASRDRLEGSSIPMLQLDDLQLDDLQLDDSQLDDLEPDELGSAADSPCSPEQLAYVIYTSGSTGRPKGVAISHGSALSLLDWARREFGPEELAGVLAGTSVCFDLSIFELFLPLSYGGTVILAANALALRGLPAAEQVRLVNTVPSAAAELVRSGPLPEGVRTVNLAGEPLKRRLVDEIFAAGKGCRVLNLYGPSEDTTYSTFTAVPAGQGEPTIGRPVGGTRAAVVGPNGRPVPLGAAGELWLGGRGLARGYLGRPGATARSFVPDPFGGAGERAYRTGDLVRQLPDGELQFLGRLDHQVKVRGFRIELGEIESALLAREGVGKAVAVAPREGPGSGTVVAYVEGKEGSALEGGALRQALQESLPDYMVPSTVEVLEALPLTPNGKVDRKRLPAPGTPAAGQEEAAAPRTPEEEVLQGIWGEVLSIPRPGVTTSFFELGGHSLLATRVVSRIRQVFGTELPVRTLFEAPTIEALARRLQEKRTSSAAPPLEAREPQEHGETSPLSFAQQRLWLLDRMGNAGAAYNMPMAFHLDGPLDPEAFGRALARVVERHETLRTVFLSQQGEPRQRVLEPPPAQPLEWVDLRSLEEGDREMEVRRLARREASLLFSLETGPLIRCRLLRLSEESHAVLLTLHHVVADGWSLGVLTEEVGKLYGALSSGVEARLPALPLQYRDFAVWQRSWLRDEVLEAEVEHWRRVLAGAPARLELPADRPRPATLNYRGSSRSLRLPGALSEKLGKLVQQEGGTRFMGLLAGVAAWLGRLSGQGDVVVGTPVAGRNRRETEGLIGFFVNSLALHLRLEGSFRDLLSQARDRAFEAYEHQDLPFERIVEELDPPRDPGSQPIFQVLLALQNAAASAPALADLEMRSLEAPSATAKFDLSVILAEEGETVAGSLEFRTDLFDGTTVERWKGHLLQLLEAATRAPDVPLEELPWWRPEERQQLLVEWPGFATPFPGHHSVPDLFLEVAARHGDEPALLFGGEEVSYGRLAATSARWAAGLFRFGVGPETLVGVALPASWQRVAAFLSILRAGGAYLPLDASYPDERLAFMLEDTEAPVVLVDETTRGRFEALAADLPPESRPRLLDLGEGDLEKGDPEAGAPWSGAGPARPENLAYVIYTSGSTGRPKGVAVSHRAIVRLVRESGYLSAGPGDRFAQISNASFDAATYEIWGSLLNGAALVGIEAAEVLDPSLLASSLVDKQITQGFFTVALFNQVARRRPDAFAAMGDVLVGGEAVDPEAMTAVLAAGAPARLCNAYGPTESTTFASYHPVTAPAGSVPIGRAIGNTSLWVLGQDLRPVPAGSAGELFIGGEGLARGYLRRPALTAERFQPDPWSGEPGARLYRTGDLVRWLPTGDVQFLGRIDGQVKLRGFRIELGEVEAALGALDGVEGTVAVILGEGETRRLVAYAVSRSPEVTGAELRRKLAEALPDYLVPAAVVVLDELPLTPNGKVDRGALPEPQAATAPDEGPLGPGEDLLAGIFRDVLGLERVGRDDDFFELGGHSLLATRLANRVREVFDLELPLARLFEKPTVASLAAELDRLQRQARGPAVPPLRPSAETGDAPLSFAQQRLWFLHQLAPDSAAYNVPLALRLRGSLEARRLTAALDGVEERHETLRTRFRTSGDEPVQRVEPHRRRPFPLVDLSALPPAASRDTARELVRREGATPFDLEAGPVLRRRLLRLGREEHVLLLNLHHVVADGWSLGLLVGEVAALYEGTGAGLPELPVQYGDYARWQRGWLQGEVLEEELAFWRRQLAGAPGVLELPADRPRPPVQSLAGRTLGFTLAPEDSRALERLARSRGATLFMTLLAAFKVLLSRLSGQEDVVVGSPVAGRSHREVEPLIGFFVNTLALRSRVGGSFASLLAAVRGTVLEAFAHQEVPFERLVEELRPERETSVPPVFQVTFALQNAPRRRPEVSGLGLEPLSVPSETAKFDLTLAFQEEEDGLRGTLELSRDLFDLTTGQRLAESFRALAKGILEAPEAPVGRLPLLSTSQLHQLEVEWNDTARRFGGEATVPEGILAQARRTPEAAAVLMDGGDGLSYEELVHWALAEAGRLRRAGVGPGSVVAVCLDRSLEQVVALLAISLAGGAYLPLDPSYPRERLAFLLRDGLADEEARILVTAAGDSGDGSRPLLLGAEELGAMGVSIHSLHRREAEAREGLPGPLPAPDPERAAYVLYTSGSTGRPKGVVISHRALANHMEWIGELLGLGSGDAVLQKTPMSFDASVWEYWAPLLTGGRLVLARPGGHRDPAYLLEAVKGLGVTVLQAVPSLWQVMVEEEAFEGCTSLRWLASGGEPLTPNLASALRLRGSGRVVNLYGPTEVTIDATAWPAEELAPGEAVPIGRPVANLEARVLGPRLESLPPGAVGELYLSGVGLARGYHRRPALTAERFVPDPFCRRPGGRMYRTGDRTRWRRDGLLEALGRVDDQIKVRGFRIEAGEVESALTAEPEVRRAAVLALGEDGGPATLGAALVLEESCRGEVPGDLRRRLAERLPEALVPSAFVVLDELPLSPSGKVDRRRLQELHFTAGVTDEAAATPPRTELESTLHHIWTDLLGAPPPGIEASFFDLGGHSLLAVQLVARIRRETGRKLPLSDLFQASTIAAQAELLSRRGERAAREPLVRLSPGSGPPLVLIHPVGGNVLCYHRLADRLGEKGPVLALQAATTAAGEPLHEGVGAMAEAYLEALRRQVPGGPYRLGGWSFGGVVAFEMTRRLAAAGEDSELFLLDSVPPGASAAESPMEEPSERDLLRSFVTDYVGLSRVGLGREGERVAMPSLDEGLEGVYRQGRETGLLSGDLDLEDLQQLFGLFRAGSLAWARYRPEVLEAAEVTLVTASGGARRQVGLDDLGWGRWIPEGLAVQSVEADHFSLLQEEEALAALTEILEGDLP